MAEIYIVFSATPSKIGRFIRILTGETYNHVSIAMDPELSEMYSFARRHYKTPFYGGFVKESLSRYHINNTTTEISICKLSVTDEQNKALSKKLSDMHANLNNYLYNHISILGSIVKKPIRVHNAYTCVEFCVEILKDLGLPLDRKKYYSVGDLFGLLSDDLYYTGQMPTPDVIDKQYYTKPPAAFFVTIRDFSKLIPRLFTK